MYYDKRIRYIDYLENGEKRRNCGNVKITVTGGRLLLEMQIKGLYATDDVASEVMLEGAGIESRIGTVIIHQGNGNFRWEKQDAAHQGEELLLSERLAYGDLERIAVHLSSRRSLYCIWREAETIKSTAARQMTEGIVQESKLPGDEQLRQEDSVRAEEGTEQKTSVKNAEQPEWEGRLEQEERPEHENIVGTKQPERENIVGTDKQSEYKNTIRTEEQSEYENTIRTEEQSEYENTMRTEEQSEYENTIRTEEQSERKNTMVTEKRPEWENTMGSEEQSERENTMVAEERSEQENTVVTEKQPERESTMRTEKQPERKISVETKGQSGQKALEQPKQPQGSQTPTGPEPSLEQDVLSQSEKPSGPQLTEQEELHTAETRHSPVKEPPAMPMSEDKWQQLERIYPHIRPFQDEREYLSLRPEDFVILHSNTYHLVQNSFLLHGFYNYKHLILTYVSQRNAQQYYIGVPGNFYEKEKQVAIMYGFSSFECKQEPAREGDFGYYMIRVEL